MIRLLFRYSDAVISVSEGVAHDLVEIGVPSHMVVAIPNPVPVDEIIEKSHEDVDHPWLSFGHSVPVILGVGRLSPPKDFATLIRAVAVMNGESRLIVVGEGPERDQLESLAEELAVDLELPGYLPNPYAWMARADVIALSSKVEGFPNVLVEAMALGKPIVATDCESGPREILEGGRFGSLCAVGDPAAMAQALSDALSRKAESESIRDRTRDWSMESIADRYLEVLVGSG